MDNNLLKETQENYAKLTSLLIEKNISITTMESCTSGLIASFITDIDNSSKIYKGSAITYCNEAKIAQGVNSEIIQKFGVYSNETSIEMARIAKNNFNTNIGIGVTGSLGIVDPNNKDSKPGEVYFTIDYLKQNTYFLEIVNQGTKFLNKVYVSNYICKELLKIINKD